MELLQYGQRLLGEAVFENALDHSAAVRVSGEGEDLRDACSCTFLVIPLTIAHQFKLSEVRWTQTVFTYGVQSTSNYQRHTFAYPAHPCREGETQIPDMLSATQTNLSHRVRDVPLHNMQMLEKQNTHTVVTFTVRAPSRVSKPRPFMCRQQKDDARTHTHNLYFNTLC